MSRIPLPSRFGDITSWILNVTQRIERDYAFLKYNTDSLRTDLTSQSSVIKLDISSVSSVIETRINSLSAEVIASLPIAWATFDGTTPPYTPSGNNVNTVTRSATGAYWISFSGPIQIAKTGVYGNCNGGIFSINAVSITSVKVNTFNFAGTAADFSYVSVMILGIP